MKTKTGLTLLIFTLLVFVLDINMNSYKIVDYSNIKSEYIINELLEIFSVATYLIPAILVHLEKDHLGDFYLDRTGLLVFITSGIFGFVLVNPLYFLVIIVSVTWMLVIAISKWATIKKTDLNWVGVSLVYTVIVIIPGVIISLVATKNNTVGDVGNFPNLILLFATFVFRVAREEFIFRCLIWGYLNRAGMQLKYSFIVQFVLFWLAHYPNKSSDLVFFISLPLIIFTVSLLASKSKQLIPSIVAHALYNTLVPVLYITLRKY